MAVEDADKMESLLDAMEEWRKRASERDQRIDACETSGDYFCRDEVEAEVEVREKVALHMNAIIDARVMRATNKALVEAMKQAEDRRSEKHEEYLRDGSPGS